MTLDSLGDYDHLLTDLWIGGKAVPASDGGRFDVLDPATGDVLATVANGTVDDAIAAVDAGDPAPRLRADDRRTRAVGPPGHAGERQGAAGRPR
jgi:hypothetical protein